MIQKIVSGKTPTGSTNWIVHPAIPNTVYVNVSTKDAGFSSTPLYQAALGGRGGHYVTSGGSRVINPTKDGFTIYIHYLSSPPVTAVFANTNDWHVLWIGIETITC